MTFRKYLFQLTIFAIPISLLAFWLAILSTHSEGFLLIMSKVLVPGLFLIGPIDPGENVYFWPILVGLQFLYCTFIIILVSYIRGRK
jgi:hypothetical protein